MSSSRRSFDVDDAARELGAGDPTGIVSRDGLEVGELGRVAAARRLRAAPRPGPVVSLDAFMIRHRSTLRARAHRARAPSYRRFVGRLKTALRRRRWSRIRCRVDDPGRRRSSSGSCTTATASTRRSRPPDARGRRPAPRRRRRRPAARDRRRLQAHGRLRSPPPTCRRCATPAESPPSTASSTSCSRSGSRRVTRGQTTRRPRAREGRAAAVTPSADRPPTDRGPLEESPSITGRRPSPARPSALDDVAFHAVDRAAEALEVARSPGRARRAAPESSRITQPECASTLARRMFGHDVELLDHLVDHRPVDELLGERHEQPDRVGRVIGIALRREPDACDASAGSSTRPVKNGPNSA